MQAVAAHDWNLDNLDEIRDSERRCRLLGSVSPEELLKRVEEEAKTAAANNTICVHWKEADNEKGCWRFETTVPLTADTFDPLFNGRMGYRAQYYRSLADGRAFNRCLVDRLTAVIADVLEHGQRAFPATWTQVERSLNGPHGKVWVADDWAAFIRDEPKVLKPLRWVAYWSCRPNETALGLAAPLPCEPALDLKGTFIREETGEPWLPESKGDRDQNIHCSGWA